MRGFVSVCLLLYSCCLWAQADSPWTIQLSTAQVNHKPFFANGHGNWKIDSSQQAQQSQQSLDQLLTEQAGLFIRDYGPAGLSLLNLRGTAAQHTAILWQGVPLNSPMNGVMDLSLLPSFMLDEVLVQPGGSAALWGSGAVGGMVQLQSDLPYQQPIQVQLLNTIGSWGDQRFGLKVQGGKKAFTFSSRLWYQQAENDFWIENGTDSYFQKHAQTQQLGVLQSIGWQSQRSQVAIHIWHQQADRSLPPAVGSRWNGSSQQDNYWRIVGTWDYTAKKQRHSQLKTAYLREGFIYQDDFIPEPAQSLAHTGWAEWTYSKNTGERWRWQGGIMGQQVWAEAPGYTDNRTQGQAATFFSGQYILNTWQVGGQARVGVAEGFTVPPVGTLWTRWEARKWFALKGQISYDYRIPTLNDRYWTPAGNPDLHPETSLGQELTLLLQHDGRSGNWAYTAGGFHRLVNDWIIWMPSNGLWTPENVQQVRTRGIEQTLDWDYAQRHWSTLIRIRYDLVRATPTQTQQPNDPSIGQQLIYTPIHQAMVRAQLQWHNWQLAYVHRFTGQRFTTSSNTHALPAFQLGSWLLAYQGLWQGHPWRLQARLDNSWNEQYDIFMGRRMPGRGWQIQFSLSLQSNNTQL